MALQKRRRFCPPSTLSWPGEAVTTTTTTTTNTTTRTSDKFKTSRNHSDTKSRGSSFKKNNNRTNSSSSSTSSPPLLLLWTDQYRPLSCKDLCVAPQKINVLKQWIQDFVGNNHHDHSIHNLDHHHHHPKNQKNALVQKKVLPKLCILVGGPGIGKSTMVRVIAKEMNMSVMEWNDTCGDYRGGGLRHGLTTSNSSSDSNSGSGEKSSMDLFEEFLHSVALPYKSVLEEHETLDNNNNKNQGTIQPSLFGSIVLLDELPNLYGSSQHAILPVLQQRFR
jgi:Holliday junction resolvasome, helicase subunit